MTLMTSFGRRYDYESFIKRTKRAANEKRTLHQFLEVIRASSVRGRRGRQIDTARRNRRGVLSTWLNPLLAEPFACWSFLWNNRNYTSLANSWHTHTPRNDVAPLHYSVIACLPRHSATPSRTDDNNNNLYMLWEMENLTFNDWYYYKSTWNACLLFHDSQQFLLRTHFPGNTFHIGGYLESIKLLFLTRLCFSMSEKFDRVPRYWKYEMFLLE